MAKLTAISHPSLYSALEYRQKEEHQEKNKDKKPEEQQPYKAPEFFDLGDDADDEEAAVADEELSAVVPEDRAILVGKDGGKREEVLKKYPDGLETAKQFLEQGAAQVGKRGQRAKSKESKQKEGKDDSDANPEGGTAQSVDSAVSGSVATGTGGNTRPGAAGVQGRRSGTQGA